MARYAIKYFETYSTIYYVEADSYEEGCKKIDRAIREDEFDGPENCEDSGYFDVTSECDKDTLNNDLYLDIK